MQHPPPRYCRRTPPRELQSRFEHLPTSLDNDAKQRCGTPQTCAPYVTTAVRPAMSIVSARTESLDYGVSQSTPHDLDLANDPAI